MLRDTIETMDTAAGYKPYEKILDAVSGSLAFAAWLAASVLQGDVRVNLPGLLPFGSSPLLFFFIFLSGLLVVTLIVGADVLARIGASAIKKDGRSRRVIAILSTGLIAALILISYTHLFFARAGGWIVSGGRGLLGGFGGGFGGFALELVFYFFAALLVQALLAAKKKLHRRFNTSVALFLVVLLSSLPELYFIFFAAR